MVPSWRMKLSSFTSPLDTVVLWSNSFRSCEFKKPKNYWESEKLYYRKLSIVSGENDPSVNEAAQNQKSVEKIHFVARVKGDQNPFDIMFLPSYFSHKFFEYAMLFHEVN